MIPTTEWIGNEDDAVQSVRERKEASVVRAATDVAEGNAAALVSLGSTGATMAAATFGLRRLKGVQRPALAVPIPSPRKPVLFLDVGANVEVRPQHLVQFAFLGAAFSAAVMEVREPTVGLLTVGEEAGKGRPEIVEAHRILTEAPGINFAGNIEGGDLPAAKVDVVVTDGFTGNVALKVMEGAAKELAGAISDVARQNPMAAVGGMLLKPSLGGLRQEIRPRYDRRRDPARAARGDDRRPRRLGPRRGRQRGADGRPLGARSTRSGAPPRCCARATPGAPRWRADEAADGRDRDGTAA